jgi:hypothetical protein
MRKFILAVAVMALGFTGVLAGDAKPTGKALTDGELFTMLENMGYEVMVKPKETDTVKPITVKVTRGDFPIDIPMTIMLSGDKSTVYFFVNLAELTAKDLGNAERLLKLLELNDTGGKNQFRVNPKTKQLWLTRITNNTGLTPAVLKQQVESLAATVVETRDHWDTKKWGGTETASKK